MDSKKWLKSFLSLAFLACMGMGMSACDLLGLNSAEGAPKHEHAYTRQVVDGKYLKEAATCTTRAVYYKSCECGEKDAGDNAATFTSGEFALHLFNQRVAEEAYLAVPATCTAKPLYFVSCICGEMRAETFESGSALGHEYTDYRSNGDETCAKDGTKTATCDRGCGATDTVTDAGSKWLQHAYEETWTHDAAYHWKNPKFGCKVSVADEEEHDFNDNGVCATCAYDSTEAITYQIAPSGTEAIAVNYTGNSPRVKIADKYAGVRVLDVGEAAFAGCTTLQEIILPADLGDIGDKAFLGCTALKTVDFNNAMQSIGASTFENCSALQTIRLPSTLTTMGERAFYGCTKLANISVPGSIQELSESLFENCTALSSITCWGVRRIGDRAFYNCSKLNDPSLPANLQYIGDQAFYNCDNLIGLKLPDTVSHVGVEAFEKCDNLVLTNYQSGKYIGTKTNKYAFLLSVTNKTLTGYSINSNTKLIAKLTFYQCNKMTSMRIPNSVKVICEGAFFDCDQLRDVAVGDGVTTMEQHAFADCDRLNLVTLGTSVETIAEDAFVRCYKLVEVCNHSDLTISLGEENHGKIAYYAKYVYTSAEESRLSTTEDGYIVYTAEGLHCFASLIGYDGMKTALVLPEALTEINQRALAGASKLTKVTIGADVLSIGYAAFAGCEKLTALQFAGTVEQWNGIEKDDDWNIDMPATQVVCSDGVVNI